MFDLGHIIPTSCYDYQYFYSGQVGSSLSWATFNRVNGSRFTMFFALGPGASGGCGINTDTSLSGGGAGGSSGAQSTMVIPTMLLPETLYIRPGIGGKQPNVLVSGALPAAGTDTWISYEIPSTANPSVNVTFLRSKGGLVGVTPASTTIGGVGGLGPTAGAVSSGSLGGRAIIKFLGAQAGTDGGAPGTAGVAQGLSNIGIMVMGGTGGGGTSAGAAQPGGSVNGTASLGTEYFPTIGGAAAGAGATPAVPGADGFTDPWYIMNYGGMGGGGGTQTSGGLAGDGGDGAPGCGGGGAGGSTSATGASALARPGKGGDGFVIAVSW